MCGGGLVCDKRVYEGHEMVMPRDIFHEARVSLEGCTCDKCFMVAVYDDNDVHLSACGTCNNSYLVAEVTAFGDHNVKIIK